MPEIFPDDGVTVWVRRSIWGTQTFLAVWNATTLAFRLPDTSIDIAWWNFQAWREQA